MKLWWVSETTPGKVMATFFANLEELPTDISLETYSVSYSVSREAAGEGPWVTRGVADTTERAENSGR